MRVELACLPGNPDVPNEDFAAVSLPSSGSGGSVVVLDGVTPPADGDTGCVHSVPWFTARLGAALQELAGVRRELTLAECLAAAIGRTADAHRATCDLSHVRTPQATVVAVRWDEERVEHLVLSDSALLLRSPDGQLRTVLDRRLAELPPPLRALRDEVRALPRGSAEREALGREYGRAVEGLRNAEGGFFTAAADPDAARRAVTGSTPRAEVAGLAALTDGATRWTEVFRLGDWEQLFALLAKKGPGELIEQVRAAEAADPEGRTHRRGKARDDAAAVLVEL
ncbi:protein phosphatase 2C domain-containing protein [Streptomyces boninensis]|uniref:protein phosphatase 2C domain-containing protein n=1 Tax=Streptomyces boninensis TaxID=2039455 RepID=UPI003B20E91F